MKYRPHRLLLEDALAETREFESIDKFRLWLSYELQYFVPANDLEFHPQGFDERCGWNSFVVCLKNWEDAHGHWYFKDMGPDYFGAIGHADLG